MANDDITTESFPARDIVFNCAACGKSLVINALGAGLAINCPDCGAEQLVPPADVQETADAALADREPALRELPDISDVLSDAREQIKALTLERDELQFRRRFLEKRHARAGQNLQALQREMAVIRKALDKTEAILKTMEDPSAGDTQPMA